MAADGKPKREELCDEDEFRTDQADSHQFEAQAISAEHPVMPQLERMCGEHTYYLDGK